MTCYQPAYADQETAVVTAPPAELKVFNRSILTFRATLLGETPKVRMQRAEAVISEMIGGTEELDIRIDAIQDSYLVLLGERRAFIVTPKDTDADISVAEAAAEAAKRLEMVVTESQQARSVRFLLVAGGFSVVATLLYLALLRLAAYVQRKLLSWLPKKIRRHHDVLKVGQTPLFDTSNLFPVFRRLLALLYWIVVLLLTYEWLTFVLRRFPYTRPWGESLDNYLLNLAGYLLDAIVSAIPGLVIALMIFFIARGASAFSKRILERLARPGTISWLNEETLQPTMRLTALAIWLFALAMAYPYLPGAGTEAFKGLSVLIGLMISLGASSVVGQAAAGLILTYTRTLRPGEFVKIGEHEGTVTELGMFTTSIRTGLGEVLTLPNSMITGTVTKNYSRVVQGAGYVVDTVVTIGYDTPWRQVEAMLLEAASRTAGILQTPRPQVFQTALSDFYPEYRLVAQAVPSEPRPRAELLSLLHANVQDVFNEYGVQIMSPHYLGDPEHEKRVPKEGWYAAPAQAPHDQGDAQ
ncbi:mechanosensitive ion channel [Pseudomonas sp. V1]|uniref:mechanosensitive ion channel family protein n=1 Tax=Pseudomonas arcuscaelestis TaxID=2710591 RepID=UPI0019401211|nr:mechanosensitive ion channel domain-containing protein [Pseudomonas arcuscaelestis]MBM3104139.1 mechanosensitive ion channel [Pseudomonas arcuscaelestis]